MDRDHSCIHMRLSPEYSNDLLNDYLWLLQVCPSAVGVGMLGLPGGPPSASSGRGGDAVALLAAVTAAGNVEFVTLQRGSVCPLMGTVSVSLGEGSHAITLGDCAAWLYVDSDATLWVFAPMLQLVCPYLCQLSVANLVAA